MMVGESGGSGSMEQCTRIMRRKSRGRRPPPLLVCFAALSMVCAASARKLFALAAVIYALPQAACQWEIGIFVNFLSDWQENADFCHFHRQFLSFHDMNDKNHRSIHPIKDNLLDTLSLILGERYEPKDFCNADSRPPHFCGLVLETWLATGSRRPANPKTVHYILCFVCHSPITHFYA